MPQDDNIRESAVAGPLFKKARDAADAADYDTAIDLYLQGLRADPENIKGHIDLRHAALARQETNPKALTKEQIRQRLSGGRPLDRMLNAEYLLSLDPNHMPYAGLMLKAAVQAGLKNTVKWIGDLIFLANNNAKKPSLQLYVLLRDSYAAVQQYDRAVAAAQKASRLKPGDRTLVEQLRRLSVKQRQKRKQEKETIEPDDSLASVDGTADLAVEPAEAAGSDTLEKARAFFSKAKKTAESGNYDYAIEMYLDGLKYAPDAVEEGHLPLCELALQRQGKDGKKPTMMEKVKRMRGKDPLEQMLNAEYLFAKDPEHLPYAETMLKAAVAGQYTRTAGWLANLIFQTNNAAKKPSFHTYVLLKDCYSQLDQYDKALAACQRAMQIKPNDGALADEYKNLSAELTVARGRYGSDNDFRASIKNRDEQEKLHAQQGVVKSQDYRRLAIESARKKLAEDPGVPKNIFKLADALSGLETEEGENEAVELLEDSYDDTGDFTFKERAGTLRIKHLKRRIRWAKSADEEKKVDPAKDPNIAKLREQLAKTELDHYRRCMEHYPTDLRAKYEYGIRLVRARRYDEAIPLFQEAQRDPKYKISSMNQIGQCFFNKGWNADAIDVFKRAIDAYEIQDDSIAKDLRYNLARALEENGDTEEALQLYRHIAQLDFSYKDVSGRVETLRNTK